jgi:hypothetical protein
MNLKKLIGIIIIMLMFGTALPVINSLGESISNDNWYYLPSYPNYAPSGLPDFDQRAQFDWKFGDDWTHCSPTSYADILWWFDSKHESQDGTPGDGVDDYPLVPDFNAPGLPDPGPNSDDHNFNNVNDMDTRWKGDNSGELIERLGYYCNTNFLRIPIRSGIIGTTLFWERFGLLKYFRDAGLKNDYKLKHIYYPDFSTVVEHVQNNDGVKLFLYHYDADDKVIDWGHSVAVAGINPDGYIALSDPWYNEMNPQDRHSDYNDASIVSHDIYEVNFEVPFELILFSWWLPEYAKGWKDGAVIYCATIISEKN